MTLHQPKPPRHPSNLPQNRCSQSIQVRPAPLSLCLQMMKKVNEHFFRAKCEKRFPITDIDEIWKRLPRDTKKNNDAE